MLFQRICLFSDRELLSERDLSYAVFERSVHFLYTMPSKNQLWAQTPLVKSSYGLSGLFTSILKMVKVSNECKILCVFKNVTLSKNIVFSFKSVDTNADLLLRSGEKGPYCSLWRRSKKPHFQSCYGKILWQRVESVEWCPALICQASMIKSADIYYSILCNRI